MRVALALGYFNVDAMLATAPPGQLEEWQEFFRLEPFGDEWHQTSLIATVFQNSLNEIKLALGGAELKKEDILPTDHYVPGAKGGKSVDKPLSPAETHAILRRMAGLS